MYVVGSYKQR